MSLAAGMGLAIALVSFADALLLRPLPVARPSEIVRVYSASPMHSLGYVSYPDYDDLTRESRALAGAIAQSQVLLAVGGRLAEVPAVRMGLAVTPNYFDVLGVGPKSDVCFMQWSRIKLWWCWPIPSGAIILPAIRASSAVPSR